jgi:hypothetical protein
MKGMWFLDNSMLSLKRWSPRFDPKDEFFGSTLVWVELPIIPMDFLSDLVVRDIEYFLVKDYID